MRVRESDLQLQVDVNITKTIFSTLKDSFLFLENIVTVNSTNVNKKINQSDVFENYLNSPQGTVLECKILV